MCTEKFKTTARDMEFIFKELEYYKVLHENVLHDMVLGGADMVWFKDIPDNSGLALELKEQTAVLEAAYPKEHVDYKDSGRVLRLIDPFLYSLDYELTHVLPNPIETPEQALNVKIFGDKPGSFEAWYDIVAVQADLLHPTPPREYSLRGKELQISFRDPIGPCDELFLTSDIFEEIVYKYLYEAEDIDGGSGFCQLPGANSIKGGRFKLYLYLVHPGVRVPSASIVAPQQQEWWTDTVFSIPPLVHLPGELYAAILNNVDMPMPMEEARKRFIFRKNCKYHADIESETYQTFVPGDRPFYLPFYDVRGPPADEE
ncbi:hypothetical protein IWW48_000588 [Coemansia sp. RSA 1200]|nr:hypothetical protein IWW48_000588 [Coemansia sp. RSA 1200]